MVLCKVILYAAANGDVYALNVIGMWSAAWNQIILEEHIVIDHVFEK